MMVREWTIEFHLVGMRGKCRCNTDDPKVVLEALLESGLYDVIDKPGNGIAPYIIDRTEFVEVDLDGRIPLKVRSPLEDMLGFARELEARGTKEAG